MHLSFSHINLMKERQPGNEEPSSSMVLYPAMWCCYSNTHFPHLHWAASLCINKIF